MYAIDQGHKMYLDMLSLILFPVVNINLLKSTLATPYKFMLEVFFFEPISMTLHMYVRLQKTTQIYDNVIVSKNTACNIYVSHSSYLEINGFAQ